MFLENSDFIVLHPSQTYDEGQRGLEPLLSPCFLENSDFVVVSQPIYGLHPSQTYDEGQRGLEPLLSPCFLENSDFVVVSQPIYGLHPSLTYDEGQRGLERLLENRKKTRNYSSPLLISDVAEASRDRTRSVDSKNTQKLGFVNTLHSA
ncbi:hypothetical protein YC2023_006338 [Brassica napus]